MSNDPWDKRYEKWDHFQGDEEDEGKEVNYNITPTQLDHSGDDNIVFSDEMLLSSSQVEKCRRLDQTEVEIWQIVVRKLRVWTAASVGADEGKDAIPCRPHCVLINNLYPLGQVISKRVMDPPEKFPTAKEVLNMVVKCMQNPPSSTPQHRPGKIVFPHRPFVGKLRKSFAAIGIECSYLSESEGIDEYVQEYSKLLVRKEIASVGENSNQPGLMSKKDNSVDLLKKLFKSASDFVQLQCWNVLGERQAFQVTKNFDEGDDSETPPESVYVSILGNSKEGVFGLGLFFSRHELERRLLPEGEVSACVAEPSLRRCALCDCSSKSIGQELKRCTRCRSTYYCSAGCQRKHWTVHKSNCVGPDDLKKSSSGQQKINWASRELSMFLGPMTAMNFDNLDMIDKHQLDICADKVVEEIAYPNFITFRKGVPSVPSHDELEWMEKALFASVYLVEKAPHFMSSSLPTLLGDDNLATDGHAQILAERTVKATATSPQHNEKFVIRNTTVVTMDEMNRIRDQIRKQMESKDQERKESGESTVSEVAEGISFDGVGKNEDGGCSVM